MSCKVTPIHPELWMIGIEQETHQRTGEVGRDSGADADKAAGRLGIVQRGIDADDIAIAIDQWPA